jgi:zinc protease
MKMTIMLPALAYAIATSAGAQARPTAATATRTAPQVSEFLVAGIPVIHKPISANDVIAVRLYIKGGSAALTPETAGIERFIAAVSNRGTKKYTGDEIAARLTSTGTQLGSENNYDFSVLSTQGVRQHWNETWDLFTQVALHPTFPEAEVEQMRGRLLNDVKQRTDNPDQHLEILADSLMYSRHAYAIDPEGTTASLASITRDQLAQWHARRLTRANLLIVVVGNVSRADLTAKIRSAFGNLPATGGVASRLTPIGDITPDVMVVKQDLPTNYIMGVYGVPSPSNPDFPAVRVATRILSERLFEEVRTKRNLTYAVSSGIATRAANRGNLYVTAVDPDTTIKVMLSEVKRLQTEPVPLNRLQQSINVFATGLLMNQQTNMGQAAALGMWELVGGGWENGVSYVSRLRRVTPAQVQQAAAKYLRNARFVVIGDPAKINRASFIGTE